MGRQNRERRLAKKRREQAKAKEQKAKPVPRVPSPSGEVKGESSALEANQVREKPASWLGRPLVRSVFYELHAAQLNTGASFWGQAIDLTNRQLVFEILEYINELQDSAQHKGAENLDKISRLVLVGLLRLRGIGLIPSEHEILDFVQFWLAAHPMGFAVATRQLALAHDWIIHSLHDGIVNTSDGKPVEVTWHYDRLIRALNLPDWLAVSWGESTVLEWLEAYTCYSRVRGTLSETLLPIVDSVLLWLYRRFPESYAIRAGVRFLPWLEMYAKEFASPLVQQIEKLLRSEEVERKIRKDIAIALSTKAGFFTAIHPAERARWTLTEFGDLLASHERLQMLVSSLDNDAPEIVAARSDLLKAIEEFHGFVERTGRNRRSWEAMYGRGPLFDVLVPALPPLLKGGHASVAQELLSCWEGRSKPWRSKPSLFIVPNHADGTVYAMEGTASIPLPGSTASLEPLIQQANKFLGRNITYLNSSDFELQVLERGLQFVLREESEEFTATLEKRLDLVRLQQWVEKDGRRPTALIAIPGAPYPFQPLLRRALGWTLPWAISLEEPDVDRPLRSALLWCTGTNYSDIERDVVASVLRRHGVDVEVVNLESMTVERFREAYQSPQYDLVWLGSHGEFPPYSPHEASIMLQEGLFLRQEEVTKLQIPAQGRRLLVLNLCDGATTAQFNSMPEIGVAATACGRHQAIISHLWATQGLPAAVAGGLLAIGLVKNSSFFGAYDFVLQTLLEGRQGVFTVLERELGTGTELLIRLERSSLDYPNAADWGSLAFYE